NLALYLVVLFFFLMGLATGTFSASALSDGQMGDVSGYLNSFFAVLKDNSPDIGSVLLQSLYNNIKLLLIIAASGFFIVGIPVMLVTMTIKGFMIGFTVSTLIIHYGFVGALVCIVCIVPPNFISVMAYVRLGVVSALNSIRSRALRKYRLAARNRNGVNQEYVRQVARISLFCLIGVIIESLMVPFVLRIFAGAIVGG
ncbi:MAG: stage II sporulation protein M, partial [Christensenellales bacterium]